MKSRFSRPMPCSPEIEPPTSAQDLHDLGAGRQHARLLARLARVVEDVRMEVAVARVEDVADAQPWAATISFDRRRTSGSRVRGITPSITMYAGATRP